MAWFGRMCAYRTLHLKLNPTCTISTSMRASPVTYRSTALQQCNSSSQYTFSKSNTANFSKYMRSKIPTSQHHFLNHGTCNSRQGNNNRWLGAWLLAAMFPFSLWQSEEEEADPLNLTLHMAANELSKGETAAAVSLYHDALSIVAQRVTTEEFSTTQATEARVYIFDAMANLSLSVMQLEHAEKLFKETMKGLLMLGKEQNHDALVEISLKLSMIYAMQQRNKEAEVGYNFCIDTQRQKLASNTYEGRDDTENGQALLGMALNSYARFLMVNSRYSDSVKMFKEAMDMAVQVYGETCHQVAVLHSDLATIAGIQDDTDLAKLHLEKAIEIGEKVESTDLAMFYLNYGEVLLQEKDSKTARRYFRKSCVLAKSQENNTEIYEAAKKAFEDSSKEGAS